MSQPPQSHRPASPLTARLYDLEYPRSLGVYSTYQEVQSVVDTLADREFPVQSTLIVGTDLKLMERVTGRRTWPKVIGQGVLSGLWMGLFLGLLFMLITPGDLMIVLSSVLMGIVFFTVWSVIGYAMTGGKRDFTSMTATIPMQYELLVEHKHAEQARQILAETGAAPVPATVPPASAAPAPSPAAAPGPARMHGALAAQEQNRQPGHEQQKQQAHAQQAQTEQSQPQSQKPRAHRRPSFGLPADAPSEETPDVSSADEVQPIGEPHQSEPPER